MKTVFLAVAAAWLALLAGAIAADKAESPFAAMAPADVRAYELDVMRRIADLALVPPRLNTSPLPDYDYDRLDYGMTIGIERTPKGRLWACWVAGGDSPKAFFVLATSDDDGETWSKPRLVVDAHSKNLPMDRSVLVGNLWTDPLGRLWLIFDQSMEMFDGRAGVWAAVCEDPDAGRPAWSAPRRIWHGVTLNKPTVLSSGEWMLPISLDQREGFGPFKGLFKELDPFRGANVFVSADQGATWERRGAARFPNPDWHEHMIVERKDGTLWMLARTAKGIMQSASTDGGRTWAAPTEPPGIRQPNARFHVRRLASGRLLLVKHGDAVDAHQGRVKLSAWLSGNDGKTWQGGLVLDDRKGVSYPDGFQAPDATIYISYDRNRAADGEILLARFTEEDILAKKLLGPKSRLKMLISRPLGVKREGRTLLRGDLPTMADLFAAAGYATGLFGKWHLGDNYPYRPQDRGFHESLWYPSSHIGSAPDHWDNDVYVRRCNAAPPVKLILDTDMSGDADDAGTLALLHALAGRGECELLATVVNRKDRTNASAAAVDAINTYYGRPDIPIGTDKQGPTDLQRTSAYTRALRDGFPNDIGPDDRAPDALDVYRRALAAQQDGSVTICSVGALSNLARLCRGEPRLVRTKVRRLVVMGGEFRGSGKPETNVRSHREAARLVAGEWPGEIVWHGFEIGDSLITGARLKQTPRGNPVRRAYELRRHQGRPSIEGGQPSYDQAAALFAVRGAEPAFWQVVSGGHVDVDPEGVTAWRPDAAGRHAYVKLAGSAPKLAAVIEALMTAPPEKGETE